MNTAITPQLFRQRQFFLTANSRAPETTLLETPRVSLWPITWPYPAAYYYNANTYATRGQSNTANISAHGQVPAGTTSPNVVGDTLQQLVAYKQPNGSANITPQEELLAFDSTLNQSVLLQNPASTNYPLPYYFQRQSPDSPSHDWLQITRNRQVANYIRGELGPAIAGIPGFGGKLETKWDAAPATGSTDWITLNIMDYSRSQINQYVTDPSTTAGNLLYLFTGISARKTTFQTGGGASDYLERNAFSVAPLRITPSPGSGNTSNFSNGLPYVTEGSYPSLKEVNVTFWATARNEPKFQPKNGEAPDPTNPYQWLNLICPNKLTAPLALPNYNAALIPTDSNPATGDLSNELNFVYPNKLQTTHMKAAMFFHFVGSRSNTPYDPSGVQPSPNFWIKVTGPSFTVATKTGAVGNTINLPKPGGSSVEWNSRGGASNVPGFETLFQRDSPTSDPKQFSNSVAVNAGATSWALTSDDITIVDDRRTDFDFNGSLLTVSIYAAYPLFAPASDFPHAPTGGNITPDTDPTNDSDQLVTSYQVDFNAWTGLKPMPIAPRWNGRQSTTVQMPYPTFVSKLPKKATGSWMMSEICPSSKSIESLSLNLSVAPSATFKRDFTVPGSGNTYGTTSTTCLDGSAYTAASQTASQSSASRTFIPFAYNATLSDGTPVLPPTQAQKTHAAYATLAPYLGFSTQMENRVLSLLFDYSAEGSGSQLFSDGYLGSQSSTGDNSACSSMITPYDTSFSMIIDPRKAGLNQTEADPRLVIVGNNSGGVNLPTQNLFVKAPLLFQTTNCPTPSTVFDQTKYPVYTLGQQFHQLGSPSPHTMDTGYQLVPSLTLGGTPVAAGGSGPAGAQSSNWGTNGIGVETTPYMELKPTWDWTTQGGNNPDGGYIQRADQDYQATSTNDNSMATPYFERYGLITVDDAGKAVSSGFFSPNRQVPSPVILGTIPSSTSVGWQTLCFSPNPANGTNHPGLGVAAPPTPASQPYTRLPDHLLLDLFWMPVAEPYPISEQFSTAGKINLNYSMMPFPYIKRKTGMDALLKAVWIYALPTAGTARAMAYDYKSLTALYTDANRTRYPIDVGNTLQAFDYKFGQGDIFRSASQICDMFLYPANPVTPADTTTSPVSADAPNSTSKISAWWTQQSMTSDNGREEPYNAIYSRVTTKSNTFTVHWRVQSLRKLPVTAADTVATWDETRDQIVSDLRGSTLIERYLDPNAINIPDYASLNPASYPADNKSGAQTMSYYYKWRVATENYFQP